MKSYKSYKARHGFQADDGRFYRASPVLALVEKPVKSILELDLHADTSSGKGIYSQLQLQRLEDMLSWPEIQQESRDHNFQQDLSQPIWDPEVEDDGGEASSEVSNWWSMNNLFVLASKWRYWMLAALLPAALGAVSCLTRVVGLTAGCRTDSRMGGVSLVNSMLSLLCHSYLQGKKQAEERIRAIPEVTLKMEFLQQVDSEAKEMKKGWKATVKAEVEGDIGEEDPNREVKTEAGKEKKGLF